MRVLEHVLALRAVDARTRGPPWAARPRRRCRRRRSATAGRRRRPGADPGRGVEGRDPGTRRRAAARPACPAGSARPRARPPGTGGRTPCSRRRRRRSSGGSGLRRAARPAPSRRRRSCSRRPRGRWRPRRAAPAISTIGTPHSPNPPTASGGAVGDVGDGLGGGGDDFVHAQNSSDPPAHQRRGEVPLASMAGVGPLAQAPIRHDDESAEKNSDVIRTIRLRGPPDR